MTRVRSKSDPQRAELLESVIYVWQVLFDPDRLIEDQLMTEVRDFARIHRRWPAGFTLGSSTNPHARRWQEVMHPAVFIDLDPPERP